MSKKGEMMDIKCISCAFSFKTCPVKRNLYMKRTVCSYWKQKGSILPSWRRSKASRVVKSLSFNNAI
mgnify:CR=1 FL=1